MFKNLFSVFTQYRGLSRSAYVLFFARIITNMGAFIWPLLTLILAKKIGYSAMTIAYISIGVGLLFIPAQIIGGKLADKFDKKKLIIIFDLISVTFFMICAFIEPSNLMAAMFILAGMFANMEGPAFDAIIAESTKPKEREKVFSLSYLGHNLGFMFGAAIGGLLFENYLNIAFIIDGLTTLTSTIMIVFLVKAVVVEDLEDHEKNEYEDSESEAVTSMEILKKRRPVLIQLMVFMLAAFIYDQWTFALPLYMSELFGANGPKYFGIVSSFNAFVVIAFTPIITRILQNLNELPKIIIGLLMYSLSYLLIRNNPAYLIFFVMMFAFTVGEIVNMLGSSPYISRRVPASHRGRISAFRGIGYFIGGVGGRVIIGALIENFSYSFAFTALGGVGIVTALIVVYNYRLDKRTFPKLYEEDANLALNEIS